MSGHERDVVELDERVAHEPTESVWRAIDDERRRQEERIGLIASENYASEAVLRAQGSVLTNKYAEGYPGRRYYAGCEHVDAVEDVAVGLAKRLFNAEHANVQPHSGSQANQAVYLAMLKPGDTVLGMGLAHGGHLSHGAAVNLSGRLYRAVSYGVRRDDELIDYDEVARIAERERPRLIVAGASAYSQQIDFARFADIARGVGAYLLVDMAHIAGLVAAGLHPNPVPHADFVTSTTHKTLRGPRGGFVLCRHQHARAIDAAVFPGLQGGPQMHTIAAKAIAFAEARQPEFRSYQRQVLRNAARFAAEFARHGLRIVSGGTETRLFLVDVGKTLAGNAAESALAGANIVVNKNCVPYDVRPPHIGSGIRIGTAAVTTRGFRDDETIQVADWVAAVLRDPADDRLARTIGAHAVELCRRFPVYGPIGWKFPLIDVMP
jgi:glycine hydroxymethyltransferase